MSTALIQFASPVTLTTATLFKIIGSANPVSALVTNNYCHGLKSEED